MTRNADAAEDDAASMSRRGFFRAGAAGAAVAAGVAAGSGTAAAQYDGWLDDVSNYDGTHDYRGQSEVTVSVGAGENGLLFGPAAILIDPGTTVVWEWTGQGGGHNVVEENGVFSSGEPVAEEGETFEYTFEDAGDGDVFRYVCEPHQSVGMKGAVAVGSVDDQLVGGEGGSGSGGSGGGSGLSASDIGTLALGFGFAGALLVPLFYAAHRKAERNA
jgi:halocyanin-like protein